MSDNHVRDYEVVSQTGPHKSTRILTISELGSVMGESVKKDVTQPINPVTRGWQVCTQVLPPDHPRPMNEGHMSRPRSR